MKSWTQSPVSTFYPLRHKMFEPCFFSSHHQNHWVLNLKEPDQALMWLKASEARARVEKKRDIDATPGTSGPPAVAAIAKDYQVTDFFMSQCGFEALIKLSSLVAPRNIEDMKFIDYRKDLINYLKPQERLVVAERTGFFQMSQGGEEAETDYLVMLH